jgi:hypothetical protein
MVVPYMSSVKQVNGYMNMLSIVIHKMNNENTSGLLYFWDPQIKNHYENVAIFKNLKDEFLFGIFN